ncbi:MAG TPA: hypothetical protein VGQ25_00365 [Gemmatimonadales bacterium]|jgi:hypothetical protein|nr:hypothetical protein [Gemmatimonadales bacterium]
MDDATKTKLHTLLAAYAELKAKAQPVSKPVDGAAERKRRACADCLRNIVRPVLDAFMAELKSAGHDASTRDHTEKEDAYPSVALSFTPRVPAASNPETALASALMFKYDPRRGILVQRSVKPAPSKGGVVTGTGDRLGTIGVDAVSAQWVETKTLSFIEDVLKAN